VRVPRILLLALLPAVVALSGCTDSYQVAASVGDLEISHADLADEVAQWQANEELASQLGVPPSDADGQAPQAVVSEVLNLRIQAELARMGLADAGVDPEADPRYTEARAAVEDQFSALFGSFDDDLRDRVADDVAVLQFANSFGVAAPPDATSQIYVSPRYGTVEPGGVVFVPDGPAAGAGATFGS
jgi:hypothetical protein